MLSITTEKQIQDIQQEFSRAFPFLKVEFFSSIDEDTGRKLSIPKNHYLKARMAKDQNGDFVNPYLSLAPGTTILEMEKKCQELFGVSVQVYRKFSKLWLEATMTANLTLQQQNDHGSEISLKIY